VSLLSIVNEFDLFRYKQNGKSYEGFVKKVGNDFIEGRFFETDQYSLRKGDFFDTTILLESFEGLEMEWWFDGQGCDNSAIGVSGCWETFLN
jgi:hypothetical protein